MPNFVPTKLNLKKILQKIPPFSFGHKLSMEFEKVVQKLIIEQYRKHKSNVDFDNPRDMTDKFLDEMWKHKDIGKINRSILTKVFK